MPKCDDFTTFFCSSCTTVLCRNFHYHFGTDARERLTGYDYPTFADFVTFVKTEARIALGPVFSREAQNCVAEPDQSCKDKYVKKPKVRRDRLNPPSYVYSHATAFDTKNSANVCYAKRPLTNARRI